jgi:hypothetical protein
LLRKMILKHTSGIVAGSRATDSDPHLAGHGQAGPAPEAVDPRVSSIRDLTTNYKLTSTLVSVARILLCLFLESQVAIALAGQSPRQWHTIHPVCEDNLLWRKA